VPNPELPTFAGLYASAKAKIQALAPILTDFNAGANLDALAGLAAEMGSEVLRIAVRLFRNSFIATCDDDVLESLIVDRGGPIRNLASAATTTLTLTRGVYVGSYSGLTAGSEVVGTAADGSEVIFTVDTSVVLGSGDASASVAVTAQDAGRAGNVDAGTLTGGFGALPSGLTLTQSARASGGADLESPADYRARWKLYNVNRARGTIAALKVGAREVDGVSTVGVSEDNVDATLSTGWVDVYVGDPDGTGNSTLAADVLLELENWRAAGVAVQVQGAAREELTTAFAIIVRIGTETTQLADDLAAALEAYGDAFAPGQRHYASRAETVLQNVSANILAVDQTTPSARTTDPTGAHKALRFLGDDATFTFSVGTE